jgi:integrase
LKIPANDKALKALKPQNKRFTAWLSGYPGLGLRVNTSGTKSFFHTFRMDEKKWAHTLGAYPNPVSLKNAIKIYNTCLAQIGDGINPADKKRNEQMERRAEPTVEKFCELYINQYAKVKKRTWAEDNRYLDNEVVPAIGRVKISEVKRQDIRAIIESVRDRGAGIASNRLLAVIKKMFNYAVEQDVIEVSPASPIKPLAVEQARERHLSEKEIQIFWHSVQKPIYGKVISDLLRFLLVTVQRKSEAVLAKWEHIDFEKKIWLVPATNVKNKKTHIVPLNALALAILRDREKVAGGNEYIFNSEKKSKLAYIYPTSPAQFLLNKSGDFKYKDEHLTGPMTVHDLRRTGLTLLAELKVKPHVRERILNHSDGSTMGRHYDKYDYLQEKTEALTLLNNKLINIITGEKKILPLRNASNS